MKVAVTAKGQDLNAEMDPRFGRAPYILIVDTETMGLEVLDNSSNVKAFKGAGIQAATMIADAGAEVLLTGHCGPNAFKTADAAGIKVANDMAGTVLAAVEKLLGGEVVYSDEANVEGHW